jgi:uncharacterized protein (DUF1778 family)
MKNTNATEEIMPRAVKKDNTRLALHIRPADKAVIARAVALEQTDLTEVIVRTALKEARSVIEAYEQVKLSKRDSARVLQALENPPAPNAELRKAARVMPERS